jgi:hypothetical protein
MSEVLSVGAPFGAESFTKPPVVADVVVRPTTLDWVRARRQERETRRAEIVHQRLASRLGHLGDYWRVLDLKDATGADRTSFLAMGPSGIYAVTVKDHGRTRISFAGDVVQIGGKRPRYVAEARRTAQAAADALTRQAGVNIPVTPVLAFAGSGAIVYHGLPRKCIVTAYQDLPKLLNARGRRLAQDTVEKLFSVAVRPETWINRPYVSMAEDYRWYPEGSLPGGQGAADKRPARG